MRVIPRRAMSCLACGHPLALDLTEPSDTGHVLRHNLTCTSPRCGRHSTLTLTLRLNPVQEDQ